MRVGAGPGESAVHAAKLKTERESHAKVAVELVASASPRESANARRISAGRYPSPVAQAPAEVIARPHPRLSRNCKASLRSGQSRRKAPAFELCLDQIVGHAKAMGFGAKSGTTDFWWQRLALALALKPPRILKEAAMAPHKSAQWELPLLPLLSPRMPSPGRQGAGSRLASYLLHDTIHVSTHARNDLSIYQLIMSSSCMVVRSACLGNGKLRAPLPDGAAPSCRAAWARRHGAASCCSPC